jgi:hypothetical protein
MKVLPVLIIALFANIPLSAKSHEFLTEVLVQLQGNSGFTAVASYNLTEAEILQLNDLGTQVDYYQTKGGQLVAAPQDISDVCDSNSNIKTCGQFDHFSQSRSAAITTCYELAALNPTQYPGGLFPVFIGPQSFVTAGSASVDHHENYDLSEGIEFECSYKTLVADRR